MLIQEEIKHVTVSMLNKLIERGHNLACVLLDDTSNQGKRVALQQLRGVRDRDTGGGGVGEVGRRHSRQSSKLFLQSSELGHPPPSPPGECAPPPGSDGRGTLACGKGVGGSPNSDEGTLVLFIYTYFVGGGQGCMDGKDSRKIEGVSREVDSRIFLPMW
jgi:hypothetical protein